MPLVHLPDTIFVVLFGQQTTAFRLPCVKMGWKGKCIVCETKLKEDKFEQCRKEQCRIYYCTECWGDIQVSFN